MKSAFLMIFLALATTLVTASTPPAQKAESDLSGVEGSTQGNYIVGDGVDYATRVLGDAWDIQSFSDVAQWFNHTPPEHQLADFQVNNGVFSARTLGDYSEFYMLFPGYEPGTINGKTGALFPISSSQFHCFYIAMYTDWPGMANNYFSLFWAEDRFMSQWQNTNYPNYGWGMAIGNTVRDNQWGLYRVDLNNPVVPLNKPWSYRSSWQALRITPSVVADTQFAVDWVRLTNCQPVFISLSGLPSGSYSLWIGTGSPERQILVINSFSPNNGLYNWDVQGLSAGSYKYYVKAAGGNIVQQGQVNIIGSPIVTFTSPSPYSGPDYANGQMNPWNMDPSDVTRLDCATYGFTNGILSLDTASRACAGPGANEADPHIFLNTADHGNLSSFRYLSFSSSTTGYPWSVPDLGMIVRLFWSLDRPGLDCWYGSRAIALDIGWQTYTVDLYDPLNGIPEEKTPADCPLISWRDQAGVGPVVSFRLDPNENITGGIMHQEFDWIRLTKVEQASQGNPVKIRVLLNKQPSEVTLNFYYTNKLSLQTQNYANTYPTTRFTAQNFQYLPFVFQSDPDYDPFVDHLPADVTYLWDTNGVAPGVYYLCAQASDGYNQATYCSQAPIQINP